jgi:CheY-like chemotaxis protein/HPt (histidine-containing phosphotransfer) domain-containing protein
MNDMTAWGHILVAEDNPVNQRVVRAMLEHLGFHVDVVSDGAEAVNAAARTRYRTIVMDCQLPILDGYLAASEIRRWQGASRHAPIIAVTASGTESDQQRCLAAGMDDYLVKPLTMRSLEAALARWAPDSTDADAPVGPDDPRGPDDDGEPALDADIVDRLERLGDATGEDLMGQLTILFLSDADAHLAAMREAYGSNDIAAVVRSAHTLKGASGNLGATQLARLFSALSVDVTANDPRAGGELLDAIGAELARVRRALDTRIAAS